MPDSVLYIAAIKFRLDIIIGLPVITQCQEIRLFRTGVMIIPDIEGKAVKRTTAYGGAGGSQKKEIYVLRNFRATFAGTPIFLDSVTVLTKKIYIRENDFMEI